MIDATRSVSGRVHTVHLSGADLPIEGESARQTEKLQKQELLTQAIGRFAAGEKDAFFEIAELLDPPLRRYFRNKIGPSLNPDDLIQETLCGVAQSAGKFDPGQGGSFSWVMTIAHHRLVDFLRVKERHRRHEVLLDDLSEAEQPKEVDPGRSSDALSSDELASQRELAVLRRRLVAEAIETLPADQQQAFNLAYQVGLTQQSMAAAFDRPIGTIKSWIRRGLERLREENPHLEELLPE